MYVPLRSLAFASSLAILGLAGPALLSPAAMAQAPAPAEAPSVTQLPLTGKQIDGLLASQKDIEEVTSKAPEQDSDKPDPKILAKLDGVAKKNGFADYAELDKVTANVALILSGFDPQTKTYVGQDAVIKKDIAALKADTQMPPLDKKKALAGLEEALKSVTPIQFPDNIKLVGKYYDKLSATMQDD